MPATALALAWHTSPGWLLEPLPQGQRTGAVPDVGGRSQRVARPESQRDSFLQPRVARHELPWDRRAPLPPTLKELD